MISVIVATNESERTLVRTLAALVPGAMAGLVSEVIIADAGSRDGTAAVADVVGCHLMVTPGPLGARLAAAVAAARAPWLLFLRPGCVPDVTWIEESNRFLLDGAHADASPMRAAVWRRAPAAGGTRSAMAEAFALMAAALGGRPRPDQGLLISKSHYVAIGGHQADSTDPETDLLRRLGRRRIVLFRGSMTAARG